ncbi:MAG: hypothetical protein MJ185_04325 [Treponema sp.]|nr:hypothetical protein [Treponema sp.]
MKTRSKITAVISAILLMTTAAGCKNSALGTLGDIETRKPEVNVYSKLTGTVENYAEIIHETVTKDNHKPGERTIAPKITSDGYDFWLYGQMGAAFCGPYNLAMLGETKGTFEVSLSKGAWNLTLVAFESGHKFGEDATFPSRVECRDGFADSALLMAKAYVDLSKGDVAGVNFVLSPEGLSTYGQVKFYIALDDWSVTDKTDVKVRMGIYDLKTGTEKMAVGDKTSIIAESDAWKFQKAGAGGVPTTDGITIPEGTEYIVYDMGSEKFEPGTYSFKIDFYDSKKNHWVWNDRIMIFPGDVTDETQFIDRLIQEVPNAPEYLFASVVTEETSSETESTDPNKYYIPSYLPKLDDSGDYYQVAFNWADWYVEAAADGKESSKSITNETHYELQVGDITGIYGTVAHTADLWDGDNPKTVYKIDSTNTKNGDALTFSTDIFNQIPLYVEGSMLANNQKVIINLELGKQYTARIRAVNYTGNGDWTYLSLDNTDEDNKHFATAGLSEASDTKTNITLEGKRFKGETINNYRVRYYLNGGSSEDENVTGDHIDFFGPVIVPQGTGESEDPIGHRYVNFFQNGPTGDATIKAANADAKGKALKNGSIYLAGWKDGPQAILKNYKISTAVAATTVRSDPTSITDTNYNWTLTETTKTTGTDGITYIKKQNFYHKNAADSEPEKNDAGWELKPTELPKMDYETADPLNVYDSYKNLDLYAQYTSTLNWTMVTYYSLKPEWISYQVVNEKGETITDSRVDAYPEYLEDGDAPGTDDGTLISVSENGAVSAKYRPLLDLDCSKIKWFITIPSEIDENYRYFRVTIKRSDGSDSTVFTDKSTGIQANGTANVLITDVSECRAGTYYNVIVEAGLPKSSLVSTVPIVLHVE